MGNPEYMGQHIKIYEWPQPCCEIVPLGGTESVLIRTKEDAVAVIESLTRFIEIGAPPVV